jgi:hypothetical protein
VAGCPIHLVASVLSPKVVEYLPGLSSTPPTPGASSRTARPCSGSSRLRRDFEPEPAGPRAQRPRDGHEALPYAANLWDRTLGAVRVVTGPTVNKSLSKTQ